MTIVVVVLAVAVGVLAVALWRTSARLRALAVRTSRLEDHVHGRVEPDVAAALAEARDASVTAKRASLAAGVDEPLPRLPSSRSPAASCARSRSAPVRAAPSPGPHRRGAGSGSEIRMMVDDDEDRRMTGRLVWLAAGVGIGVAVARQIERSGHASSVEAAAVGIARQARRVVDAVVADGRAEMRQREARLRTVLAAPGCIGCGTPHPPRPAPHARRVTKAER